MNNRITLERFDGYLQLLQRSILLARAACLRNDAALAEAILDAAHNLPRFLIGQEHGDFEKDFYAHYLEPLVRRYPELQELAAECPRP